MVEHLEGLEMTAFENTPLVYVPTVTNNLLQQWPGPRFTAYLRRALYVELNKRYERGFLFSTGTVTHCCVDLAVKMGAKEIVLLGADFSFPKNKSHTNITGPQSEKERLPTAESGPKKDAPSSRTACDG